MGFYIGGPTAVGKTALALAVAEEIGGEIVGADAFQVYEGLPLLTAKPSAAELRRVRHHLVNCIPLQQRFDAATYLRLATEALEAISARGKQPIVVGGTGLYFRLLMRGLADVPPSDPALRAELEQASLEELQSRLIMLDPHAEELVDLKNPRRVVRALEVALLTGKPFTSFRHWDTQPAKGAGVFLYREREDLYARINARVESMFAEGVAEEVARLGNVGPTAAQTLGLPEIRQHLAGKLSQDECIALIQQATRRYAKRQMTWFRKEPALRPICLSAKSEDDVVREILELARQTNAGG